jgi:hypothetical protein
VKARETRARLVTATLVLVIVGLTYVLVAKQRKEVRLRAALALFENRAHEWIYYDLNDSSSFVTALKWTDQASLEEVIAQIEFITNRPRFADLRFGLPIHVDPIGLREAGQSLASRVSVRPPTEEVSVQSLLHGILEPMGLAFQVKDGTLTITSRQAVERSHERLISRLDQPISPNWAAQVPLRRAIEQVRFSTRGPGLPVGLPIYEDVDNLFENFNKRSLEVNVAPLPGAALPVREQLRRILEPLALKYELRDGVIMIVAKKGRHTAIAQ